MADNHKNFSYSTVLTAPSPADSGTSLVVQSGDGAKFPTVSFNATVWPTGVQPLTTNAEIVRVTAISTDTFTITRAQESTSARSIVVGDQIAATISVKTLTDVEQANLLDGIKADTVAQTVTRGSLIYGNSTPKWDELVLGAANRVLWSDGTDISWSASPRLANIADTGGTNRITTATASPHLTLSGDLLVSGNAAILTTPAADVILLVAASASYASSLTLAKIGATGIALTGNSRTFRGVAGTPVANVDSGSTGHLIEGLNYTAGVGAGGAACVVNILTGVYVKTAAVIFTGTITITRGIWVASPQITLGTPVLSTIVSLDIDNQGSSNKIVDAYGVRIANFTVNTGVKRAIEVLSATADVPYFRVVSGFTAAANQTPIYISEGATPTLRQMKTRVWDGTAGHGFTNGDLVAYLV